MPLYEVATPLYITFPDGSWMFYVEFARLSELESASYNNRFWEKSQQRGANGRKRSKKGPQQDKENLG